MIPNRVLITGASGLLGYTLCSHFSKNHTVTGVCYSHSIGLDNVREIQLDLADTEGFLKATKAIKALRPEIIIHTAGLTSVDQCEANPQQAKLLNVQMTEQVTQLAIKIGAKMVHISTDHLFDGILPLVDEATPVKPINVYARTKAEAEVVALKAEGALIIRTNFYGKGRPWRSSFSDWLFENLVAGKPVNLFCDVFYSPIAMVHLAELLDILTEKKATGVFNVASPERISKYEFGIRLARKFKLNVDSIHQVSIDSMSLGAPRPRDMSLSVHKLTEFLGFSPPGVQSGIETLGLVER